MSHIYLPPNCFVGSIIHNLIYNGGHNEILVIIQHIMVRAYENNFTEWMLWFDGLGGIVLFVIRPVVVSSTKLRS